ncbi:hypothetical protein M2D07_028095 [Pseudomonas sp. BGr12]|uniref:hypothetical protein n=1 Tax=Pseudomonas sp. BGr12 TaxID=2936269 RepID=UPI002559893C|nr:hypothetical protein [Pseudomonas sp. BJa5]MDL2430910.1 hypothetical protein [Pseudomonas sp. BJa5]
MNAFDDTLYRVMARHMNRAIPTRISSGLSSDPDVSIGIATIKIVTEDQIQAIAFGSLDGEPEVIVRLDPIGRDVTDLVPFANFMEQTASRALAADGALRVWIPHSVTLEALDILGHRYWQNQTAPDAVVRMGKICRTLAHEATFPGQQVVADVSTLLQDHIVTGLAPIEEGHLDAMLAWLDPTVRDPLTESRERIRLPASGILPNTPDYPSDDRVDRLRKEAKRATGHRRAILEADIEATLRRWVLREWRLLVGARQAFLGLGLPSVGLDGLVKDSTARMNNALANGHYPARRPDKLAALLAEMEAGLEKAELAALESDPALREQAQRAGGVVRGVVSDVRQPRRNFKPCSIDVDSDQGVIRFRVDDKVRVVGTNVTGIVRSLSSMPTGGTKVSIEITGGFRQTGILSVDSQLEVLREGYGFVNHRAFKLVSQHRPWVFFGEGAPTIAVGTSSGRSALAIATEVRRP